MNRRNEKYGGWILSRKKMNSCTLHYIHATQHCLKISRYKLWSPMISVYSKAIRGWGEGEGFPNLRLTP